MSVRETIFANLEDALNGMKNNPLYPSGIKGVTRYDENKLTKDNSAVPFVMLLDTGKETLLVKDATGSRFETEIFLGIFHKGTEPTKLHSQLNAVISDIKAFLDSSPNLGSAVLDLQYTEGYQNRFGKLDATQVYADSLIKVNLVYHCVAGVF